jgi:hypothetical protein
LPTFITPKKDGQTLGLRHAWIAQGDQKD